MSKGIETILDKKGETLAIIIHSDFKKEGVNFLTPQDFTQQMGFISHPAGKKIDAHTHQNVERKINTSSETLFIREGKLKVDLYDGENTLIDSKMLEKGDVILLVGGGHGFECIEAVEMIEVKQGPYLGDEYRTKLNS